MMVGLADPEPVPREAWTVMNSTSFSRLGEVDARMSMQFQGMPALNSGLKFSAWFTRIHRKHNSESSVHLFLAWGFEGVPHPLPKSSLEFL